MLSSSSCIICVMHLLSCYFISRIDCHFWLMHQTADMWPDHFSYSQHVIVVFRTRRVSTSSRSSSPLPSLPQSPSYALPPPFPFPFPFSPSPPQFLSSALPLPLPFSLLFLPSFLDLIQKSCRLKHLYFHSTQP